MPMDQYLVSKIINHMLGTAIWTPATPVYLSLFVEPSCLTEISGGSYARQSIPWPAPAANAYSVTNGSNVVFTNMPAGNCAGAGVHDAVTAGNRMLYAALPSALVLNAGDTVTFNSGQLVLQGM